uniref:Uncharacterized protein n=1 Tax=Megaselia scalaris TaxID=36166 RepID=T1GE23_MEGSC
MFALVRALHERGSNLLHEVELLILYSKRSRGHVWLLVHNSLQGTIIKPQRRRKTSYLLTLKILIIFIIIDGQHMIKNKNKLSSKHSLQNEKQFKRFITGKHQPGNRETTTWKLKYSSLDQ